MKEKGLYSISFKGLSLGNHQFDYLIDKSLFESFETSIIYDAEIAVRVILVKHHELVELNIGMSGWAEVECDRCLDPLKVETAVDTQMFVKFKGNSGDIDEDDDDFIILSQGDDSIDLAPYFYEIAHLTLPIRRVHGDDENGKSLCNAEMISKLEQFLIK
jgi:uncharacterized metal-binding protein YceD (DUF177 family)